MMPGFESRVTGGLLGLLVGDALGVPFEFHSAEEIPNECDISFDLPAGFRRAHRSAPAGAYSDDGAQALCLLDSLLRQGSFDIRDFANRLHNWSEYGYMAVEGEVFDIGLQTGMALRRIGMGVPVQEAALADVSANGNGSLMRVLPLALWHQGSDAELVELAHQQSHVTHAHARAKVCCAYYCLVARCLLQGKNPEESCSHAEQFLQEHYHAEYEHQLVIVLHELKHNPPRGSGYVVDTLAGALAALHRPNYASAVRYAISLGNDTDTTAAVAGGLAGILYGVDGIPQDWLQRLAGASLYSPLQEQLQQHLKL